MLALRTRERTLNQEKPEACVTDYIPAGREKCKDVSEEAKVGKPVTVVDKGQLSRHSGQDGFLPRLLGSWGQDMPEL